MSSADLQVNSAGQDQPQAAAFMIKINLTGCAQEDTDRLSDQIMSQVQQIKNTCEPYGGLVDVKKMCIVFRIYTDTPEKLQLLQEDAKSGAFVNNILKNCGIQTVDYPDLGIAVSFPSENDMKMKQFFEKRKHLMSMVPLERSTTNL